MKYTPEITEKIVQEYRSGVPILALSEKLGVPSKSIIAKLSSLGVYVKKPYLSKTGEPPISKEELLQQICDLMGESLEPMESLLKSNKTVLKKIIHHLS